MRMWLSGLMLLASAGAQDIKPMAKAAKPVFEVAAIKPTKPGEENTGFSTRGARVVLTKQTVASMMMLAYGVHHKQIVGGPAWLEDSAYDVNGTTDVAGEPNLKQVQGMVRGLLADRFGLKTHVEKREMGYFALRLGTGKPKMTAEANPEAQENYDGSGGAAGITMQFTSNSMDDFKVALLYFVDRPVVNETGLAARYDFKLTWTPDEMKVGGTNETPGLATAIREELGLRLESAKGPVEVLVVDAVARPSDN